MVESSIAMPKGAPSTAEARPRRAATGSAKAEAACSRHRPERVSGFALTRTKARSHPCAHAQPGLLRLSGLTSVPVTFTALHPSSWPRTTHGGQTRCPMALAPVS